MEETPIDELAMMLLSAAALTGESPEDLAARLSDADLASLYLNCAHKVCAVRGPQATCPVGARCDGFWATTASQASAEG
ncbi:hypothetical protein [Streptomyces sp. NPDC001530]|uniref:hypothetical protein n=1 Tax=Streptomyces sp. NPDC001530 TaxID=3364582 RepID=UPI0036967241